MADIKQYEPLWGSWHVESPLGEGSFGKVYKIRKDEFSKTYYSAVKILSIPPSDAALLQARSEGMDDASARSYFHAFVTDIVQEIDLMSEFRGNSHIVSLEDHKVIERPGEIGWDILIRMELLTPLTAYVTEKPMEPDEIVKLGIHICRALELCSVKHTIHRDIKPDNIFVSQYGEFKLGDFGIARQIDRTVSGLSKKGTESYMAPEVFKGEEYGSSVDTYSLGIGMYRFLNKNRAPFLPAFPEPITPNAKDEALRRRMSGEPLPPIEGIDPRLADIVHKACAFDRDGRYESAAVMREELEALAGGMSYAPSIGLAPERSVPRPEPRLRTLPIEDRTLDATESVFTSKTEFFAEKPARTEPQPNARPEWLKKLPIISGLSFGVLCALCFLSGVKSDLFISLPLYGLCAVQCYLGFRYRRLNIVFLALLFADLGYAFFVEFDLFDYHLLTLACGLAVLEADRTGGRKYSLALSVALIVGALVSGVGVFRAFAGVAAGSYQPYVAGAMAVPVVLFLTAVFCLLTASNDKAHRRYASIGLIGLQCLPALIFLLHLILSHGAGVSPFDNFNTWFYIVDADFIDLSTEKFSWWTNGRILGQMIQLTAFVPFFVLAEKR